MPECIYIYMCVCVGVHTCVCAYICVLALVQPGRGRKECVPDSSLCTVTVTKRGRRGRGQRPRCNNSYKGVLIGVRTFKGENQVT